MSTSSERTPLTSGSQAPHYVFMTNHSRLYRSRVKQCQCCICAAILTIFVVALVVTVSFSINHDTEDKNTTTTTTLPTPNTTDLDALQILLASTWPLPPVGDEPQWPDPPPSPVEIESAILVGKAGLRARDLLEETTPSLAVDTPSNRHQTALGTGAEATRASRAGYIVDVATRELFKGEDQSNKSDHLRLGRGPSMNADWLPEEMCGDVPDFDQLCPGTPYRSVDGVCNNPDHPRLWGVALRPFRRLLPAAYTDGVSAPRLATDGTPLPSARDVSVLVHRPIYKDDPKFTVMLAVWGQFMDHDITATALNKGSNSSTISCCYAMDTPEVMHPECFPVYLSAGDPYYNDYNVTCMEFVRSAPAPVCSLGPREQLNQASSFIDGSTVYGPEAELAAKLRTFKSGLLRMTITPDGRALLPYDENPDDGCNQVAQAKKNKYCFLSGDRRANENLHLTTMHLLFARHHNYLASKMAAYNPTWDDERLYQEARRVLSAQMQHITYNEFLPVLLGEEIMTRLDIKLKDTGYHQVYDKRVDPSVANGFAASAFRFAHTLLPSLFRRLSPQKNSTDYVELHKLLFDPFQLYEAGTMDDTIKGAFVTHSQKIDTYFTKEVTQKLFQGPNDETSMPRVPGLDLVSLNIQRGRDHGLPPYPEWRKFCGFSVPTNFTDLEGIIDPDTVQRLASIYKSVDDVDMYSGALSEIPVDGGALGPTVLCVLSDQFYRTKIGDRFWYETSEEPQAFTPEQLQEIRKTTLAGVICINSDHIETAQPWVMRLKKEGNYPVPCYGDVIQHPDIAAWEEKEGAFTRPGIARAPMGPVNHVRAIKKKQKEQARGAVATPISVAALVDAYDLADDSVAITATVGGGLVTTDDTPPVQWWSGPPPVGLTPSAFRNAEVYWTGDFRDGSVAGNFSFSVDNGTRGGRFSFDLVVDDGAGVDVTAGRWFKSRIYFHDRDAPILIPVSSATSATSSGATSSRAASSNAAVTDADMESAKRMFFILIGSYRQDQATFVWSGDVVIVIPS